MKTVTTETRQKLHDTHVKLAQDPQRLAFLRKIAQDPVSREKRAEAMKKKWADPAYKAKMKAAADARALAKAKAKAETPLSDKASLTETTAPIVVEKTEVVKKKRVVTDEQKARYAATKKAKREAAKS